MARKRMVSPELLTSRSVAALPIPTRYAFIALWMYVDDEGRGVDDLDLIKAHSWPLDRAYTVRKVGADLDRMASAGMVCRYQRDGEAFLHLPAWSSWQKVSHPTPSRIVPCAGELYGKGHDEFTRLSGAAPVGLSAIELSSVEERLGGSGGTSDRVDQLRVLAGVQRKDESA